MNEVKVILILIVFVAVVAFVIGIAKMLLEEFCKRADARSFARMHYEEIEKPEMEPQEKEFKRATVIHTTG